MWCNGTSIIASLSQSKSSYPSLLVHPNFLHISVLRLSSYLLQVVIRMSMSILSDFSASKNSFNAFMQKESSVAECINIFRSLLETIIEKSLFGVIKSHEQVLLSRTLVYFKSLDSNHSAILRIRVVFPVLGPPVIKNTFILLIIERLIMYIRLVDWVFSHLSTNWHFLRMPAEFRKTCYLSGGHQRDLAIQTVRLVNFPSYMYMSVLIV